MTRERPTAQLDPRAVGRARPGIADAVRGLGQPDRGTRGVAIVFAAVLHAGLFTAVARLPTERVAPAKITEVELAPPPPEPPAPPPPKAEEPEKAAAAPIRERAAAPPVARAGNVLTARSDTPAPADAVDFVTDPEGKSFGSGVVARGGTLDRGVERAPVAPRAPATRSPGLPSDGLVADANLSRRATLDEPNPCAGFYPSEATVDRAAVTLALVVRADGAVASASVVSETPPGQGFGGAARACLQRRRFAPALDRSGTPVNAAATIRVRFVR